MYKIIINNKKIFALLNLIILAPIKVNIIVNINEIGTDLLSFNKIFNFLKYFGSILSINVTNLNFLLFSKHFQSFLANHSLSFCNPSHLLSQTSILYLLPLIILVTSL